MSRIACINPSCSRTAAAEKYESDDEVICRKCWNALPSPLRGRYQQLRRREKLIVRMIERRISSHYMRPEDLRRIEASLKRQYRQNWQSLRTYFQQPDKPAGLEGFLREVGL